MQQHWNRWHSEKLHLHKHHLTGDKAALSHTRTDRDTTFCFRCCSTFSRIIIPSAEELGKLWMGSPGWERQRERKRERQRERERDKERDKERERERERQTDRETETKTLMTSQQLLIIPRAEELGVLSVTFASSRWLAKQIHMSPGSFSHTKQFCQNFTPIDQLLCSTLHKNGQLVQLFEAWTWLVCMPVCLRLCATSQLQSHSKQAQWFPWPALRLFRLVFWMGAIHKMAATLGDSHAARALRGSFYGQPGLPHLAKHFFPGFLVLLQEKKPLTNENLSGSTPPRQNADSCFHRATILDTERSERTWLCRQPFVVEQRRRWRRYFGKTELISMHGVTTIARVPVWYLGILGILLHYSLWNGNAAAKLRETKTEQRKIVTKRLTPKQTTRQKTIKEEN